jgi:hypothetical protein
VGGAGTTRRRCSGGRFTACCTAHCAAQCRGDHSTACFTARFRGGLCTAACSKACSTTGHSRALCGRVRASCAATQRRVCRSCRAVRVLAAHAKQGHSVKRQRQRAGQACVRAGRQCRQRTRRVAVLCCCCIAVLCLGSWGLPKGAVPVGRHKGAEGLRHAPFIDVLSKATPPQATICWDQNCSQLHALQQCLAGVARTARPCMRSVVRALLDSRHLFVHNRTTQICGGTRQLTQALALLDNMRLCWRCWETRRLLGEHLAGMRYVHGRFERVLLCGGLHNIR